VFTENKLTRRSLLSALSLYPAARLLSGQQLPDAAPKYSADAKLVNVFATVRNRSGKIIKGLTKDDFLLDEEGRTQTIKFFSQESSLPLYLGLMVDTSGSQRRALGDERAAGIKFFDQILRPDRDLAFVLHFDSETELLQDFTASRANLEKALDLLQVADPGQQQQQGGGPPQRGGGYPGGGRRYPQGRGRGGRNGGTRMYDAVLLASEDLMSKQKGRKALVLLTDGVDTGSKVTLFQGIGAAQKADTLVYSILFADSEGYGGGGPTFGGGGMGRRRPMPMPGGGGGGAQADGKKVLQQVASETGGRFFQVSRSHPLDKIFADIEEDLRNQYNIGYTPDQPSEPGLFRHIHLAAKKKDLVVQSRTGYYSS
jgi:VWFA-related protein